MRIKCTIKRTIKTILLDIKHLKKSDWILLLEKLQELCLIRHI